MKTRTESLKQRIQQIASNIGHSRRKVLIVGTFRSATNAIQTALAEHYEVEPVFNDWFWKHGVPPTTPSNPVIIPQAVPIIVMSKDPVAFNESIFDFGVRVDLS